MSIKNLSDDEWNKKCEGCNTITELCKISQISKKSRNACKKYLSEIFEKYDIFHLILESYLENLFQSNFEICNFINSQFKITTTLLDHVSYDIYGKSTFRKLLVDRNMESVRYYISHHTLERNCDYIYNLVDKYEQKEESKKYRSLINLYEHFSDPKELVLEFIIEINAPIKYFEENYAYNTYSCPKNEHVDKKELNIDCLISAIHYENFDYLNYFSKSRHNFYMDEKEVFDRYIKAVQTNIKIYKILYQMKKINEK